MKCSHFLVDVCTGTARLSGFRFATSMVGDDGVKQTRRFDYPEELSRTGLPWMSPELMAQNRIG